MSTDTAHSAPPTVGLTLVPADTPAVFDVQAVVEQERDSVTHEVQVTLTDVQWRMLVGDIAARVLYLRSVRRPIINKLLTAGSRPCGKVQQDALDDLVHMLSGATHIGSAHALPPVFTLTPEDAGAFALALAEASEDPVVCPCGNVVQQPTQLTGTCGFCVDAMDGDR